MTQVRMDWQDLLLEISGHAGAGEAGYDIVCAGISALSMALLNTLVDSKERGRTELEYAIDEKDGRIRMKASPHSGRWPEIRDYYKVTMNGLRALAQEYPKNIRIGEVWYNGSF